jgi:hypothetical protein
VKLRLGLQGGTDPTKAAVLESCCCSPNSPKQPTPCVTNLADNKGRLPYHDSEYLDNTISLLTNCISHWSVVYPPIHYCRLISGSQGCGPAAARNQRLPNLHLHFTVTCTSPSSALLLGPTSEFSDAKPDLPAFINQDNETSPQVAVTHRQPSQTTTASAWL